MAAYLEKSTNGKEVDDVSRNLQKKSWKCQETVYVTWLVGKFGILNCSLCLLLSKWLNSAVFTSWCWSICKDFIRTPLLKRRATQWQKFTPWGRQLGRKDWKCQRGFQSNAAQTSASALWWLLQLLAPMVKGTCRSETTLTFAEGKTGNVKVVSRRHLPFTVGASSFKSHHSAEAKV